MGGLVGTLLGPEETGASLGASGLRDHGPRLWRGGGLWWARLFFENCTVDASISGEDAVSLWDRVLVCDLF